MSTETQQQKRRKCVRPTTVIDYAQQTSLGDAFYLKTRRRTGDDAYEVRSVFPTPRPVSDLDLGIDSCTDWDWYFTIQSYRTDRIAVVVDPESPNVNGACLIAFEQSNPEPEVLEEFSIVEEPVGAWGRVGSEEALDARSRGAPNIQPHRPGHLTKEQVEEAVSTSDTLYEVSQQLRIERPQVKPVLLAYDELNRFLENSLTTGELIERLRSDD